MIITEGFDWMASATDFIGQGYVLTGSFNNFITGRFGGQAAITNGFGTFNIAIPLQGNKETIFLGAAVNTNYTNTTQLFNLAAAGTITCQVNFAGVGSGNAVIDAAGTTIGDFTVVATASNWTYLEAKIVAGANGTGIVTVRQDAVVVFGPTELSTTLSAANYFDTAHFNATVLDDIYLSDGTSETNPSWLGPLQCIPVRITGDVSNTGSWALTSGTDLYAMVNETIEDGATTTIENSTNNAAAVFEFSSLAGTLGTIVSVKPIVVGLGAGSTVAATISSNGTLHTTPFSSLTGTFTGYAQEYLEVDPGTGERWTIDGYNASIKGILKGAP